MSVLTLARLGYAYPDGAARALDGVDLELDAGLTLLTGASGSGKSTLLRVCNGLVPHFHGGVIWGTAQVLGRDVHLTRTRDLARDVGFVFQDPELQAVYATVARDVAFGLENLGVPSREIRGRAEEALATCGIGHLRDRAVATLSGGERQRLALAGVLAMRPRLLVLDEPLSQLDPEGATALLAALDRVVRAGTTVLVAEHHEAQARGHAQRTLRMDAGRLRPAGGAAGARDAPGAASGDGLAQSHESAARCTGETGTRGTFPGEARTARDAGRGGAPGGWALHGVVAGHGREAVLHDLDLGAASGEVVAVTGPNGSGKSTLLRTVAGLLPPLRGRVERSPGRVAYLPQNPSALLHRPTVRSEIEWTLRRARAPESVGEVLDSFGLGGVAGRDPRDLSSGERQRAALGAALAGAPSIALLDEPTRGMDAAARAALVAAVRRVAARGGSAVIATHDAELAGAVATRVIDLGGGAAREIPARQAVPA